MKKSLTIQLLQNTVCCIVLRADTLFKQENNCLFRKNNNLAIVVVS